MDGTLNLFVAAGLLGSPLFVIGAIVMVSGLASAVLIIARYLPAPQLRVGVKPWGLRDVALWVAVVGVTVAVTGLGYGLLGDRWGRSPLELAHIVLPVELLMRTVLLAALVWWLHRRQVRVREAFGLTVLPARLAFGWGLGFALAVLPLIGVLLFLTNALGELFGFDVSDQPIVAMFIETESPVILAGLIFFAVVLAPVFEETLFRGCAYPALKARYGFLPAGLMVSLVFAATHFHGPSLVPLLVLGLGLTLAYELTGSLLTSIVMHGVFNGIMLVHLFASQS